MSEVSSYVSLDGVFDVCAPGEADGDLLSDSAFPPDGDLPPVLALPDFGLCLFREPFFAGADFEVLLLGVCFEEDSCVGFADGDAAPDAVSLAPPPAWSLLWLHAVTPTSDATRNAVTPSRSDLRCVVLAHRASDIPRWSS